MYLKVSMVQEDLLDFLELKEKLGNQVKEARKVRGEIWTQGCLAQMDIKVSEDSLDILLWPKMASQAQQVPLDTVVLQGHPSGVPGLCEATDCGVYVPNQLSEQGLVKGPFV
nr:uncharacterized protein LOC112543999 isoform X1 [Pelodiscus sinensis]|eukprot:XP_025035147.1 uncharacterized protein LOC112543999 isoform X1 [Pelodiscus sinensis]